MKNWTKLGLLLAVASSVLSAAGPAELSSTDFVKILRSRRQDSTCGIFTGTVQHQRRGGELLEAPIRFAVLLAPERTTGQVIIGKSGFLIGQELGSAKAVTTVTPMAGSAERDLAGYMGVRASDLALGFLFWDLQKELPPERVSLIPCRVFLLKSPDGAETVKAFCATQYFFPLKAEFYKTGDAEQKGAAPRRVIEVHAFGEKNGLYYARSLRFSGPGWRTRIEFAQDSVVTEPFDVKKPRKLFLSSPAI